MLALELEMAGLSHTKVANVKARVINSEFFRWTRKIIAHYKWRSARARIMLARTVVLTTTCADWHDATATVCAVNRMQRHEMETNPCGKMLRAK